MPCPAPAVVGLIFAVFPLRGWGTVTVPIPEARPGGYQISKTDSSQAAPSGFEGRTDTSMHRAGAQWHAHLDPDREPVTARQHAMKQGPRVSLPLRDLGESATRHLGVHASLDALALLINSPIQA